eukprot:148566-Ditylum_brightwellii.AAC.1
MIKQSELNACFKKKKKQNPPNIINLAEGRYFELKEAKKWVKVQAEGYKTDGGRDKGKQIGYHCNGNHLLQFYPELKSGGTKQAKMGLKLQAPKKKESHTKLNDGNIPDHICGFKKESEPKSGDGEKNGKKEPTANVANNGDNKKEEEDREKPFVEEVKTGATGN